MAKPTGSLKTGGRTKGTPNKSTERLRQLFADLPERVLENLELLESPLERLKVQLKLMEFVFPKLRSVEVEEQRQKPLSLEKNPDIEIMNKKERDEEIERLLALRERFKKYNKRTNQQD